MPADPNPKLTAAREALVLHDHHPREICPECCEDVCDPCVDALRWALGEIGRLTADLATLRANAIVMAQGVTLTSDTIRLAAPAVTIEPGECPCPACGYDGAPGTTHATSCLYPAPKEPTHE